MKKAPEMSRNRHSGGSVCASARPPGVRLGGDVRVSAGTETRKQDVVYEAAAGFSIGAPITLPHSVQEPS
jgi:hypothetical protein